MDTYELELVTKSVMSYFQGDSIFWVEVEKIKPNPHQPRKEFDQEKLRSLAESIRQYGVLQPLVVTRREFEKPEGGIAVEYELIAGERRLRAARIASIQQVPVIIKSGEEDALLKLELAIIENVQREDLNPIDRAFAFHRLANEFGFKHTQIGKKIGKSREFISNTLRLLSLPEEIKDAVANFSISEGHGRTLMMLNDRPEEQSTLFKEIVYKNLTVRETETIARRIAHDKVRKKERAFDPELVELEDKLSESLGTRVQIERRDNGGKILIDYFSNEDIKNILSIISATARTGEPIDRNTMLNNFIAAQKQAQTTEETGTDSPQEDQFSSEAGEESENGEGGGEMNNFTREEGGFANAAPQEHSGEEREAAHHSREEGNSEDLQTHEPDHHADRSHDTSRDPTGAEEEPRAEADEEADHTEPEHQSSDKEKGRDDDEDLYSVSNFSI